MLIYNDATDNLRLYKSIFRKRRDLRIDSPCLTIISGYVSSSIMSALGSLGFDKINVIIGMFPNGLDLSRHQELINVERDYPQVNFFYTKKQVHSKLYVWHDQDKINEYSIGSANFSVEIKYKLHKEILSYFVNEENDISFVKDIKRYQELIVSNAIPISQVQPTITSHQPVLYSDNLSLLSSSNQSTSNIIGLSSVINEPNACSGLNWGYSSAAPRLKDAYVGIVKSFILANTGLIPARGIDKKIAFEAVWDDGTVMEMCFAQEGATIAGEKYPKGIESDNNKNILGDYLRKRITERLGINYVISDEEQDFKSEWKKSTSGLTFRQYCYNLGREDIYNSIASKYITLDILNSYGRTDIGIVEETDGNNTFYRLDFSVD